MARRTIAGGGLGRAVARSWYDPTPPLGHKLLRSCLAPVSWAYGAAAGVRASAYDRGWLSIARAPIPVVSVGNIVVGGAGKTPVVVELAMRLSALGHRVAVVSRGYGASTSRQRLVSDGSRVLLDAVTAGDEPYLIAKRCPGVVVLAGPDRASLVFRAAAELGSTVALLDDGMQHRRLHRDLEVVVVDASAPLGNGRLFPRGPMREGVGCISRAGLLWLTRVDETPEQPFETNSRLDRLLERAICPVVHSRYEPHDIADLEGRIIGEPSRLKGRRVFALSGIARPASFIEALARVGARVVCARAFPDHHPFSSAEISSVAGEAAALEAQVVTTEKDAARLGKRGLDALVLRVRTSVTSGGEELDRLLDVLLPKKEAVVEPPAAGSR